MNRNIIVFAVLTALVLGGAGAILWYRHSAPANPEEATIYSDSTGATKLPVPALPKPTKSVKAEGAFVVHMTTDGFSPGKFTVKKGTGVVWENDDADFRWPASDLHPTHTIYPEFDPQQPVPQKSSWEFTFEKVGTWRFHDHLKPYFTGTITVTE